jgi:alpha-galactosidase
MRSNKMGSNEIQESSGESRILAHTISARGIDREISLDARKPALEWASASPVTFCADWQGQRADPARQTEVRVLWTPTTFYLRFVCRYREVFVFDDSDPDGRRDGLWDRDVAEAFLQPEPARPRHYKEFEVSPNGMWIDLQVGPGGEFGDRRELKNLKSGLRRSAWIDQEQRVWSAELAIPMRALTADFDADTSWRANFYRVEGRHEPRFYSAWRATKTAQPDFHVPGAFGRLEFR